MFDESLVLPDDGLIAESGVCGGKSGTELFVLVMVSEVFKLD